MYITTTEALKFILENAPTPVTLVTLIAWCKKYKLGGKIGGRWWINKDKLIDFLDLSKKGQNGKTSTET